MIDDADDMLRIIEWRVREGDRRRHSKQLFIVIRRRDIA